MIVTVSHEAATLQDSVSRKQKEVGLMEAYNGVEKVKFNVDESSGEQNQFTGKRKRADGECNVYNIVINQLPTRYMCLQKFAIIALCITIIIQSTKSKHKKQLKCRNGRSYTNQL